MTIAVKSRLSGIESLRAYAAVAVIMSHLISVGGARVPEYLDFILIRFPLGVPFFFAVSGFSLAYGYTDRLFSENDIKTYFVRRFARIAPLFYLILAVQLLIFWFEHHITFSLIDILINIAFVFNFVPHMSDGIALASWSIGVEMAFYVLLPVMLLVNRSILTSLALLVLSIIVANQFYVSMKSDETKYLNFIWHNLITNLPYFMWGMLGYHTYVWLGSMLRQKHIMALSWSMLIVAFLSPIILHKEGPLFNYLLDKNMRWVWSCLLGAPLFLACVAMALHPTKIFSNAVTRYLGKVSFSLYLIHPIVLIKLNQFGCYRRLYDFFGDSLVIAYLTSFAVSIALITAISSLTFRFIETPGMNWGKKRSPIKSSSIPVVAT